MSPRYLFPPFLPAAHRASRVQPSDGRCEPFDERRDCAEAIRKDVKRCSLGNLVIATYAIDSPRLKDG